MNAGGSGRRRGSVTRRSWLVDWNQPEARLRASWIYASRNCYGGNNSDEPHSTTTRKPSSSSDAARRPRVIIASSSLVVNLTPHRLAAVHPRLPLRSVLLVLLCFLCATNSHLLFRGCSAALVESSSSFSVDHHPSPQPHLEPPSITFLTTASNIEDPSEVIAVVVPPSKSPPLKSNSHDPMWIHRLIFASLNGLLFLLGLANVLVLFIVSRYRRMRTVTNILIFNLCLADLIYISFLPVVIMFQLLRDWMFGIVACKLFYITESTAKYASVYFVGVLSLDRYFALCHPQVCKRYRRPSLALLVSAIGWFVTAVLMIPIYMYSTVIGKEGERFCTVAWPNENEPMFGGGTASLGGVPSGSDDSNLLFYNWTASELELIDQHHQQHQHNFNFSSTNMSGYDSMLAMCHSMDGLFGNDSCLLGAGGIGTGGGGHPGAYGGGPPSTQFYFITLTFVFCFGLPAVLILFFYFKVLDELFQASNRAERLKKRREKTYRKVTRMVLAVISFYLICWLPYWIQFLVVTFAAFSLNNALKIFFNTIHLLPYLNCAINPILYSLMTDNFRRILSELFPIGYLSDCCRRRRESALAASKSKSKSNRGNQGGGIALMDKASTFHQHHHHHHDDEKGNLLHGGGAAAETTGFTSLSASISPSIRMVSDFSINLLMARTSSRDDVVGSPSAASINSMT